MAQGGDLLFLGVGLEDLQPSLPYPSTIGTRMNSKPSSPEFRSQFCCI